MNQLEQYEKNKTAMVLLSKNIQNLIGQRMDIETKQNDLLAEYIIENNILQEKQWNLDTTQTSFRLYAIGSQNWKNLDKLKKLDRRNCYLSINFESGIRLNCGNNQILMHCNNNNSLFKFIKKHKLNIAATNFLKREQELKKELKEIDSLHKLITKL